MSTRRDPGEKPQRAVRPLGVIRGSWWQKKVILPPFQTPGLSGTAEPVCSKGARSAGSRATEPKKPRVALAGTVLAGVVCRKGKQEPYTTLPNRSPRAGVASAPSTSPQE